ncbi:electron transport complex subunit RsxG [Buchnera aphidicola (Mindarus keteleerifoliae)]|uniref:electron transport complex subunit RsxG n=1 Tax=Buchnera aphidicola TaxID=9 RepID=UPI0031B6E647
MLIKIFRNIAIIGFFSIIFSGLTAFVHENTKYIINSNIEKKEKENLRKIMNYNKYDNNINKNCYIISNKLLGDNKIHHVWLIKRKNKSYGMIVESVALNGYSGSIKMMVGSDFLGKIFGVRILEHHETPGLGDKIELKISNWITFFSGMNFFDLDTKGKFALKKDGGIIDQFTGASITPRAVINQIKNSVIFISNQKNIQYLQTCKNRKE